MKTHFRPEGQMPGSIVLVAVVEMLLGEGHR